VIVLTRIPGNAVTLARAFRLVLPALAESYVDYYAENPLPSLYHSSIRYRPEPQAGTGLERWDDPWTIYARGWADCDDLILARLTELRARGEPAAVRVVWRGTRMHVQVRRASGALEDPSKLLLKRNGG
jgi:hypothetical protein